MLSLDSYVEEILGIDSDAAIAEVKNADSHTPGISIVRLGWDAATHAIESEDEEDPFDGLA